jgi:hypothetical protein
MALPSLYGRGPPTVRRGYIRRNARPVEDTMPYYECPKCGGGYVIDVPPSARPICDRDGARLKKTSDASYERNARRD